MTLLEAMSLSKPCLVTNVGGNSELITDGVNGYVVTSEADEEFSAACIKLCNDDELRQAMGQQGRSKLIEQFSIDKMVAQFVSLYK